MSASLSAAVAYVRQLTTHGFSDREMLDRFARSYDEDAFAEIVRIHGPMVQRICKRVLRHDQDAEDAFQATFLVLARSAASIRIGESLAGWLYRVAFRLAVRTRETNLRRQARHTTLDDESGPSAIPVNHELLDVLDAELQRLPEVYRAAIVLCYLEGRTQHEAARLLATSTNAVNSRLKRGRQILRERLIRSGLAISGAALVHALTEGVAAGTLHTPAAQALAHAAALFAANADSLLGVSPRGLLLAKGAAPIMVPAKLKFVSALLAAVTLLGMGAWLAVTSAANQVPQRADDIQVVAQKPQKDLQENKRPSFSCIILWMSGGPSQLDTFDPKKDNALLKAIDTNVEGLQFTETFPLLAKQANHLAVIRSLTHRQGDHQRATYLMHTGCEPVPKAEFPGLGNVLARELSGDRPDLPRFVFLHGVPTFGIDSAPGLLGKEYAAVSVGRRMPFGAAGETAYPLPPVADFEAVVKGKGETWRKAVAVAFDLSKEKETVRNAYGQSAFGSGCLLARRLVECGVPVVEVTQGGWDTHTDALAQTKKVGADFDAGLANLLKDLHERKKLDTTLIVCLGEFGRTPIVNANGGRDHYPFAFTALLAGRGIKGGQAIGKTSKDGLKVEERPVSPPELLATIYHALGVDPSKTNRDSSGVNIPLVEKGHLPVKEALR